MQQIYFKSIETKSSIYRRFQSNFSYFQCCWYVLPTLLNALLDSTQGLPNVLNMIDFHLTIYFCRDTPLSLSLPLPLSRRNRAR